MELLTIIPCSYVIVSVALSFCQQKEGKDATSSIQPGYIPEPKWYHLPDTYQLLLQIFVAQDSC